MNQQFPILSAASVLILAGTASAQSFFKPPVHYSVGVFPSGVVAGDFDRDGDMDLAVFASDPYGLSILENAGNSQFRVRHLGVLPFGGAGKFVAADFNDDGLLDLAATLPQTQRLAILTNAGNMEFKLHTMFSIGADAHGLAIGDINLDGMIDIAVANSGSGTVNLFTNRGRLAFKSNVLITRGSPRHVAFGDFNLDGYPDLAVTDYTGRSVKVYANNTRGGFFMRQTITESALQPDAIAFADMDNDGDMDIVAAANEGRVANAALVYTNTNGRFAKPRRFDTPGRGACGIVSVDFNLDGNFDLVTSDEDSNSVSFLQARGDGRYWVSAQLRVDAGPEDIIAVDLDGDGDEDLVTVNSNAKTVSLLYCTTVQYTR